MARINISIDDKELAMIDQHAKDRGMSRSEFIRHMHDWYVMSGAESAFARQHIEGNSLKTIYWACMSPELTETNHELIEEAYK